MHSSMHFAISLIFILFTAITIPDVSHAYGKTEEIEDCALRKRGGMNARIACEGSPDDAYAKEVMQTTAFATRSFDNVIELLANMPQPCIVDDAWVSAVKQEGGFATGNLTKVVELLVFPKSCRKTKYFIADNKQRGGIKKATSKDIKDFKNVITQLVSYYLSGSKKDVTDKTWASAVTETGDTIIGAFGDLLKKLEKMPPPCSEVHNKWADSVLQTTDTVSGVLGILADQLLLSQSTGKSNMADKALASKLIQATHRHSKSFQNLIGEYVALITGSSQNA